MTTSVCFFESILREDQSVIRFVDSDYTYLNETLAPIYRLQNSVKGPPMRRVRPSDAIVAAPSECRLSSPPPLSRTNRKFRAALHLENLSSAPTRRPASFGQEAESPEPSFGGRTCRDFCRNASGKGAATPGSRETNLRSERSETRSD